MPAFFTADLQARIPDDFMPAQAVQDLNAQSRDGRRPTVQDMGLLRRVSHASPIGVASESDRGMPLPSQLLSLPSDPMEPTASAATRPAATGAARPYERDPPFKPDDRPDAADEEDYQTLPEELPCEDTEVPKEG